MLNKIPQPKIKPSKASIGIVNNSCEILRDNPKHTNIILRGFDNNKVSRSITDWTYIIKIEAMIKKAVRLFQAIWFIIYKTKQAMINSFIR